MLPDVVLDRSLRVSLPRDLDLCFDLCSLRSPDREWDLFFPLDLERDRFFLLDFDDDRFLSLDRLLCRLPDFDRDLLLSSDLDRFRPLEWDGDRDLDFLFLDGSPVSESFFITSGEPDSLDCFVTDFSLELLPDLRLVGFLIGASEDLLSERLVGLSRSGSLDVSRASLKSILELRFEIPPSACSL